MVRSPFKLAKGDGVTEDTATAYDQAADGYLAYAAAVSATAILPGAGGLVGAADIAFWPIWGAAALGTVFGDWSSHWLVCRHGNSIARVVPLSRRPDMLPQGEALFRKWGALGVLVGRLSGPRAPSCCS